MKFKKLCKTLLFPPVAILFVLLPVSVVLLVHSVIFEGAGAVVSYVSYVLAAYTLIIWCVRIPSIVRFLKRFKNENKYAQRWLTDAQLRINVSLYGSLLWNTAYAVLQLGLGFWHQSVWYWALAGYYICLAVMRFFLVRYTHKYKPGELIPKELKKYRACGVVFLVMNLALSAIIFFRVFGEGGYHHHAITAIAMATYTTISLTVAIRNLVKYSKLGSPVYVAAKIISLTTACVSVLTLESTMLTTFNDGTVTPVMRKLLLGISGGVISAFIIGLGIYMIVDGSKKLKRLKEKEENNGSERTGNVPLRLLGKGTGRNTGDSEEVRSARRE